MDTKALKRHLFEAYGGFADKRVKDLDKRDIFTVDDRDPGRDYGADGKPYGWFCGIFARVVGPHCIEVELWGGVPTSEEIHAWLDAGDASFESKHGRARMTVPITLGQESRLRELADLTEHIVRPGGPRYDVAAYKYVCPRTAGSLRRLADVLAEAPRTA